MNYKGIAAFKSSVTIGDELSVNTKVYSYCGIVSAMEDDYFVIEEGSLKFFINYSHVWAYSNHSKED